MTSSVTRVHSWWAVPHMVVADLAWLHMSPTAQQAAMQALSPLNPFYPSLSSFHASSIWLDVINTTVMPAFQPWHYSLSALPASSPGMSQPPSPAPPVPAPASLVAVLSSALAALQGDHIDVFGRAFVLRVLLNLLADLHQPLHCADRQHVGGGEAAGGGVGAGEGVGPVGGGGWARQVAVEQYVVDEADTLFHFWSASSPPPASLPHLPLPPPFHTCPGAALLLRVLLLCAALEAAGGAFEEVAGAVRGDNARPAAAFHVDERDVRAAALALAAQFPLSAFTPREVQEVDVAAWAAGSGSMTASVVYSGPLHTAAAPSSASASASVPGTASPVLLTHDYNIHVQEVAKSQLALAAYRLAALLNASFPQPLSQDPDTYSPCISLQDAALSFLLLVCCLFFSPTPYSSPLPQPSLNPPSPTPHPLPSALAPQPPPAITTQAEERGARAAPLLATALGMAVAVALALVVMLYRERESMQRQMRDLQQLVHQDPHSPSGGLLASSQGL
ncbi:unnamed protein product [Closterium sp. Naga37s-1]|nr:unnamed protein product [Closterium sp. Naga37s-1]